jgi:ABC-type Fe3+/spermidine/putrescine transport system ATPase subunit
VTILRADDATATQDGAEGVVACRGLTKRFGALEAVAALDLDVFGGELLALLGPSGCGKTTTLRLVGGFERPDAGTVDLAGVPVAGPDVFVPPERRRIGVVFQDYALFPHLTVAANVGYGVRDRSARRARAAEMLELVGLGNKATRRPHELSGGEQQRVAIARALAPDPAILLLDEPFSNLDAALRLRVRAEVRDILLAANATAVFVTHDQEEALELADRVSILNKGKIEQLGTPEEVYEKPASAFVLKFLGNVNLFHGRQKSYVRPHDVVIETRSAGGASEGDAEEVPAEVEHIGFGGAVVNILLRRLDHPSTLEATIPLEQHRALGLQRGQRVFVTVRDQRVFENDYEI